MALINCPECNHQISDQALTCPNCGYSIRAQESNPPSSLPAAETVKVEPKKRNIQKLLAVLLTIISLIGIIASKGTVAWAVLFFAGLFWFIVLRIVRD